MDRQNDRPRLDDLRDSGQLEQDADKVIFIHGQPDSLNLDTKIPDYSEREIIVAKHKDGPIGSKSYVINNKRMRFEEFDMIKLDESTKFWEKD
jgi:replicative DNA helicase